MVKKKTGAVALVIAVGALLWHAGKPEASPRPVFKFNPPSTWQKAEAIRGIDAAWKLQDSPTQAAIVVMSQKGDEPLDTSHLDEQALVTATEQTRAFPYRIIGINDWKVDQHRLGHASHGVFLEMTGHYTSPADTKVKFIERDYFVGSDSFTVSFSEDVKSAGMTSDESVAKLLDRFEVPEAGR